MNPQYVAGFIGMRGKIAASCLWFLILTEQLELVWCYSLDKPRLFSLQKTFSYNSSYWTNKNELNVDSSKDLTPEEAKTAVYWSTSFYKMCLGMRNGDTTRWLLMPENGASVREVLQGGRITNLVVNSWKSLLDGALLPVRLLLSLLRLWVFGHPHSFSEYHARSTNRAEWFAPMWRASQHWNRCSRY